ncbi:MAG: GNAT family N-acetyltransferase [Halieaceae bacterium]|nr:GNAT family N-acetyltransferase [Halieaceae bacterium]
MHTAPSSWQAIDFDQLTPGNLYEILRLRQQVFGIEQDCLYQDLDGLDQQALHLCAWQADTLLAYLRALPPGVSYPESSLGRIVVSPEARGQDLGREIVRRGIELNRSTWPDTGICISAQAHLEAFYQSLGFATASGAYDEDGIPHIKMRLARENRGRD